MNIWHIKNKYTMYLLSDIPEIYTGKEERNTVDMSHKNDTNDINRRSFEIFDSFIDSYQSLQTKLTESSKSNTGSTHVDVYGFFMFMNDESVKIPYFKKIWYFLKRNTHIYYYYPCNSDYIIKSLNNIYEVYRFFNSKELRTLDDYNFHLKLIRVIMDNIKKKKYYHNYECTIDIIWYIVINIHMIWKRKILYIEFYSMNKHEILYSRKEDIYRTVIEYPIPEEIQMHILDNSNEVDTKIAILKNTISTKIANKCALWIHDYAYGAGVFDPIPVVLEHSFVDSATKLSIKYSPSECIRSIYEKYYLEKG